MEDGVDPCETRVHTVSYFGREPQDVVQELVIGLNDDCLN